MELKEKLFNAIFDNAFEFRTENVVPECEQIADEYAVQYAEWCCARAIGVTHFKLNEEELEQFKKEKGWTI